jgi:hypothetical protein
VANAVSRNLDEHFERACIRGVAGGFMRIEAMAAPGTMCDWRLWTGLARPNLDRDIQTLASRIPVVTARK